MARVLLPSLHCSRAASMGLSEPHLMRVALSSSRCFFRMSSRRPCSSLMDTRPSVSSMTKTVISLRMLGWTVNLSRSTMVNTVSRCMKDRLLGMLKARIFLKVSLMDRTVWANLSMLSSSVRWEMPTAMTWGERMRMSPPSREEVSPRSYHRGACIYSGLCSKINLPKRVSRFLVSVSILWMDTLVPMVAKGSRVK